MVAFNNNDTTNKVCCNQCGREYLILYNKQDYDDWKNNKGYIQDVLAYLTASERELLISGICNYCWKKMYGIDEIE